MRDRKIITKLRERIVHDGVSIENGHINIESIDIAKLEKDIEEAREIGARSTTSSRIFNVAILILDIRKNLQWKEWSTVKKSIDFFLKNYNTDECKEELAVKVSVLELLQVKNNIIEMEIIYLCKEAFEHGAVEYQTDNNIPVEKLIEKVDTQKLIRVNQKNRRYLY